MTLKEHSVKSCWHKVTPYGHSMTRYGDLVTHYGPSLTHFWYSVILYKHYIDTYGRLNNFWRVDFFLDLSKLFLDFFLDSKTVFHEKCFVPTAGLHCCCPDQLWAQNDRRIFISCFTCPGHIHVQSKEVFSFSKVESARIPDGQNAVMFHCIRCTDQMAVVCLPCRF